jgi:hypothetical protein
MVSRMTRSQVSPTTVIASNISRNTSRSTNRATHRAQRIVQHIALNISRNTSRSTNRAQHIKQHIVSSYNTTCLAHRQKHWLQRIVVSCITNVLDSQASSSSASTTGRQLYCLFRHFRIRDSTSEHLKLVVTSGTSLSGYLIRICTHDHLT